MITNFDQVRQRVWEYAWYDVLEEVEIQTDLYVWDRVAYEIRVKIDYQLQDQLWEFIDE